MLVVDNSAVVRQLLAEIINRTHDLEVVGTARDPGFAWNKLRDLDPDVITLDIDTPRMDGLAFLEDIMKTRPVPVVLISAASGKGQQAAMRAFELGAVDYIQKPEIDISSRIMGLGGEITEKIRTASKAKIRRPGGGLTGEYRRKTFCRLTPASERIIAIGASTGGTGAITEIITALPESTPGIVIVQHMPPVFTRSFADRLDSFSKIDVREAVTGDRVSMGNALIAPGNKHMSIKLSGSAYYTEVNDGPMVNFVRPSVDVLFRTVAKCAGGNAVGVLLTGMGEDGARGLLEMKLAGAFTIAQDEASSVVFGMPKKAIELGAVDKVVPLEQIPRTILQHI